MTIDRRDALVNVIIYMMNANGEDVADINNEHEISAHHIAINNADNLLNNIPTDSLMPCCEYAIGDPDRKEFKVEFKHINKAWKYHRRELRSIIKPDKQIEEPMEPTEGFDKECFMECYSLAHNMAGHVIPVGFELENSSIFTLIKILTGGSGGIFTFGGLAGGIKKSPRYKHYKGQQADLVCGHKYLIPFYTWYDIEKELCACCTLKEIEKR